MPHDESLWVDTTDGELLKHLFGYYPTLHEARIRKMTMRPSSDSFEMVVDYQDSVGTSSSSNLQVRILLTWIGITTLHLSFASNYLSNLSIQRKDANFHTNFEVGFGTHGKIVSEQFDVKLEKVDPEDPEDNDLVTLQYA